MVAKKRTLIIPDIHERVGKLKLIEEKLFPEAGRIVMLGDFFDTFKYHNAKDAAVWVKEHPEVEKLWGNHDAHYAFKHPMFKCSGYSRDSQIIINSVLDLADWKQFKIYTKVGKYTVSHAGFHPALLSLMEPAAVDHALELAFSGGFHAMWAPGVISGGYAPFGGPTWLRWEQLEPIKDLPQIVGHTIDKDVRRKSWDDGDHLHSADISSYCLDTALQHVMWVDEDTNAVEIERL